MRYTFAVLPIVVLISVAACGEEDQSTSPPPIAPEYKRAHQDPFRLLLTGQPDAALEQMSSFAETYPTDAEAQYMLTVIRARTGQTAKAFEHMRRAIELGLPAARFVGGTRTGLESLHESDEWKALATQFKDRPVNGPMLGCAAGQSVKIWLRTATAANVQAVVSRSTDFTDPVRSPVVGTTQETDFTAEIPVTGLKPDTRYHYRLFINPETNPGPTQTYTFRTPPAQHDPASLTIAFGGGAGYVPPNERVWDTALSFNPAALVLLGDNVYIDDPEHPEMQHYCYYRRQGRPEFQRLTASTPVYAIWDDHDFGINDCSGGPDIDKPAWKRSVWNVFRNNWVNPYYGQENHPGCYFDFYLADLHFIMLDGRYYRTPPGTDPASLTMIGPKQKQWLFDTIRKSKGTFRILCSPVPWTFLAKGDSPDTWNGFHNERNEIFNFLATNRIDGVVLMSADRHRSDLWKIDRDDAYPLYEFNSSRFTNQHVHTTMPEAEFSYNKTQSFGLVDFDTTAADPTVTYRIATIDGQIVHTFTLKLSQLTH